MSRQYPLSDMQNIIVPDEIKQSKDKSDYICGLCEYFITQPVELLCCGTLVCKVCASKNANGVCQFCKHPTFKISGVSKRAENKILQVRVECPNVGCNEFDSILQIVYSHLATGCAFEVELCQDCDWTSLVKDKVYHECRGKKLNCAYAFMGCKFIGNQQALDLHYNEDASATNHLKIALNRYEIMNMTIETTKHTNDSIINNLKEINSQLNEKLKLKEDHLDRLGRKILELEKQLSKTQHTSNDFSRNENGSSKTTDDYMSDIFNLAKQKSKQHH